MSRSDVLTRELQAELTNAKLTLDKLFIHMNDADPMPGVVYAQGIQKHANTIAQLYSVLWGIHLAKQEKT